MQHPRYKIKKGDQVMVMAGRERGKTGRVARVIREKGKVVVEKLNMVKRHQRPTQKHRHGGIIEKEAPLAISNVMIICDKCKGPVRVGKRFLDDGTKVRYCKKCGEVLDK
ncbi:MAG TPA: 50S ribosomal protein L24 [Deltaproteobacteria bacterium]|nr:50S ribosomal protein L24 [Deltaproteobacteria bacterium]